MYIWFVYMKCIYGEADLKKVFRGFRFEIQLYDSFCGLAQKKGLTATGALERFMASCVELEELVYPEQRFLDFEREARVLVNWLSKGRYLYRNEDGVEINIAGRLLTLLPKVADNTLKKVIEEALKGSVLG